MTNKKVPTASVLLERNILDNKRLEGVLMRRNYREAEYRLQGMDWESYTRRMDNIVKEAFMVGLVYPGYPDERLVARDLIYRMIETLAREAGLDEEGLQRQSCRLLGLVSQIMSIERCIIRCRVLREELTQDATYEVKEDIG